MGRRTSTLPPLTPERSALVTGNLNLVRYIVQRHWCCALAQAVGTKEDAWQIGYIALVRAVATFDESRGTKFSTLACTCIGNAMFAAMDRRELKKNKSDRRIVSLEAVGPSNLPRAAGDADELTLRQDLDAAIYHRLTPEQEELVRRVYGIGVRAVPVRELARERGVSRQRIIQILEKCRAELRRSLKAYAKESA